MKSKKAQIFSQLGAMGIGVATLAITLVVVFLIISQARSNIVSVESIDETNTSTFTTAYNATNELATAVDDIPGWVPLIVIAAIGSILLGLVALFRRE